MSAALQICYTTFDSAFFKLPTSVRSRIEAKIDEMGLRLKTFPHHRLKGHNLADCGWEIIELFTPSMRSKTSFTCLVSAIERKFIVISESIGVKAGVLVHPVRLACTGNPSGPSRSIQVSVCRWRRASCSCE